MKSQWPQTGLDSPSLYLPAVLRSNKPPKSVDDNIEPPSTSSPRGSTIRSSRNITAKSLLETGFDVASASALDLKSLGKVTGSPTRVHWKPDLFSVHCDQPSSSCKDAFTTFRRRHHCRRCGLIFCHLHSIHSVPLDQDANFHPKGTHVRACENCWIQWTKWVERRCSAVEVKGAKTTGSHDESSTLPSVEISPISEDSTSSDNSNIMIGCEELARSVPREWNWSTF